MFSNVFIVNAASKQWKWFSGEQGIWREIEKEIVSGMNS